MVGLDAFTLHRAMKAGWLSDTLDGAGKCQVEVAELKRAFASDSAAALQRLEPQPSKSERVIAAQRVAIEQRDATIRDLRARRDNEVEERRRVQERLTALLTHRQGQCAGGEQPELQRAAPPIGAPVVRRQASGSQEQVPSVPGKPRTGARQPASPVRPQ